MRVIVAEKSKRLKTKKKARARSPQFRASAVAKIKYGPPSGYATTQTGLLAPSALVGPIKASKMRSGLKEASKALCELMNEFDISLGNSYCMKEIELALSFNAEGKFMGFGIGGATSISIRVAPK